jgi:two-component system chemotaxis response regulator CheB
VQTVESHADAPGIRIVVVGASAGGVEALKDLAAALPAELACPVLVVLHLSARGTSVLAQILDRAGPLPARTVTGACPLPPHGLLVAPNDRHVLVGPDGLSLDDGPPEHGVRPSLDPSMRSAAATYGAGVVGVVLSGTGEDGTDGLRAIQAAGGRILVQDPDEARYPGMPQHALDSLDADGVLLVAGIAARLGDWSRPGAR